MERWPEIEATKAPRHKGAQREMNHSDTAAQRSTERMATNTRRHKEALRINALKNF
jgi:hypothetical protein